jgi:hypothetical protein
MPLPKFSEYNTAFSVPTEVSGIIPGFSCALCRAGTKLGRNDCAWTACPNASKLAINRIFFMISSIFNLKFKVLYAHLQANLFMADF